MSNRRIIVRNDRTLYILVVVVIVLAFLLLGGWPWLKGLIQGSGLMNMGNLNWPLILICLGIGSIIGILIVRRR